MKKVLLTLLLMISMVSMAQDVILLKNGSSINSKVVEINDVDIKYKKWSNIEGPIYTVKIIEVQSVKYQNGEKDEFSVNSTKVKVPVYDSDDFSYSELQKVNKDKNIDFLKREELLRKARVNNSIGTILAIGGLVGGLCLGTFGEGQSLIGATLALGIPGFLGGCMFWYDGAQYKKEAYEINVVSLPVNKFIINDRVKIESTIVCFDSMKETPSIGFGIGMYF